jgi:hypothetical protein
MRRFIYRAIVLFAIIVTVAIDGRAMRQQAAGEECDQYRMALIFRTMDDPVQEVPELARIVGEPFDPIRIGVDSDDLIASKLFDIQCRAEAIDALGAIGAAAAPSSGVLIDWAITERVIPARTPNWKNDQLFVDLVTIDVLERMRVAGAVNQFGFGAAPAIAASLKSSDGERRKLAVAILNEKALPIAALLLKSGNCDDRQLGIALLVDMWPVAAKAHLQELKNAQVCDAALTEK